MSWQGESLDQLKARVRPVPPTPKPAEGTAEDEAGDAPDFGKPYRAFGPPRARALRCLYLYFNAAERRRYGKKKMQVQYEHLDSDDPGSEGFAADGRWFALVVAGARKALRITVRGLQLEEGYDGITRHCTPWIRSADADREFGQDDGPVITSIEIEPVEEAAESAGQRQRASG